MPRQRRSGKSGQWQTMNPHQLALAKYGWNKCRSKSAAILSLRCLIAVAALTASCAPSWDSARNVRKGSLETGQCSLHHVPLQTITMYDMSEPIPTDPEKFSYRLRRRYPNAVAMYEPTRSRYYQKPVIVRICPVCQRLFLAGVKKEQMKAH